MYIVQYADCHRLAWIKNPVVQWDGNMDGNTFKNPGVRGCVAQWLVSLELDNSARIRLFARKVQLKG